MTPPIFTPLKLKVEPLSPVHVGSGIAIEPHEYLLERVDNAGMLFALDLPKMVGDLDAQSRREYDRVIARGDFPGLRGWLRKRFDRRKHARFFVQVQDSCFDQLARHQDDPARQGVIELSTRDAATGCPYLPGSSIKGAIRTALVDVAAAKGNQSCLRQEADDRRSERSSAKFEAMAFGNLRDNGDPDLYHDPLRQLAISDARLPQDGCCIDRVSIVRAATRQRRPGPDPSGIQMHRDLTWSASDGEAIAAETEVRLHTRLVDSRRMGREVLKLALTPESICEACNGFYRPRLIDEMGKFRVLEDAAEVLRQAAGSLGPRQCLIRLGRHSHFECVTVSEPFHRPGRRGAGATRTYAGVALEGGEPTGIPLGWVRLSFLGAVK